MGNGVTQAGRRSFRVLGVRVDAVQIPEVVNNLECWIAARRPGRFIAVTSMHGVMEAQQDRQFKEVLEAADLVVPDGMPLVWLGRGQGHSLEGRVYGPELMDRFCRETRAKFGHFLYGGLPGVPERLAEILKERYDVRVVGTHAPPFRPLTPQEDAEVVALINRAAPDVVWVGLGTPKQERWMREHASRLHVPVLVGVGAAFDFLAGVKPMAPRWMREHGLEWLFRLLTEPRRLWRRYLMYGSQFLCYVVLERLGWRQFD